MSTLAKVVLTFIIIFVVGLISAAISRNTASGSPGGAGGVLGLITLAGITAIWRSKKQE